MAGTVTYLAAPAIVAVPEVRSIGGCLLIEGERVVPQECAVAFVVNGTRQGSVIATPTDLEDLAVGFCVSQGVINRPEQVTEFAVDMTDGAIEVRLAVIERGLRPVVRKGEPAPGTPNLPSLLLRRAPALSAESIERALAALASAHVMRKVASDAHAAALWRRGDALVTVREDIEHGGAVDKLVGALLRAKEQTHDGVMLTTGRACVHTVDKAVRLGVAVVVAAGSPSALAIRRADAHGITLIACAQGGDFSIFTHIERIAGSAAATPARTYAFLKAVA